MKKKMRKKPSNTRAALPRARLRPAAIAVVLLLTIALVPTVVVAGGAMADEGPRITSCSPLNGKQGQTLDVTITGADTNFAHKPLKKSKAVFTKTSSPAGIGKDVKVKKTKFDKDRPNEVVATIEIDEKAVTGDYDVNVITKDEEPTALSPGFTVVEGPRITGCQDPEGNHEGVQGETLQVTITGADTHFAHNLLKKSKAVFEKSNVAAGLRKKGIEVTETTVNSETEVVATIEIDEEAEEGAYDVNVETRGELTPDPLSPGFTVTALPGPSIVSCEPNHGTRGETLDVKITGVNTHFSDKSKAAFKSGATVRKKKKIKVTETTFNPNVPDQVVATIEIGEKAKTGAYDVTVETESETATMTGGFSVDKPILPAKIVKVDPNSGKPGDSPTVTITGKNTHFIQGTPEEPGTTVDFGDGITVNSVTVTDEVTLEADVVISDDAVGGKRDVTVTTDEEIVVKEGGFNVKRPIVKSVAPREFTRKSHDKVHAVCIVGQYASWGSNTVVTITNNEVPVHTIPGTLVPPGAVPERVPVRNLEVWPDTDSELEVTEKNVLAKDLMTVYFWVRQDTPLGAYDLTITTGTEDIPKADCIVITAEK